MNEKTLIQITDELRQLMFERQEAIDMGKDVSADLDKKLNDLVKMESQKIDACVSFVKMAENQITWLDAEIEHLKKQKQKYEKSIDEIKEIAKTIMLENGILKMEGRKGHSFTLRKNESVTVTDLTRLPEKLIRQKITIEPDKNAIKAVIKNGEHVQGAHLTETFSVVVK
jgi:regulator of replication initiation timing